MAANRASGSKTRVHRQVCKSGALATVLVGVTVVGSPPARADSAAHLATFLASAESAPTSALDAADAIAALQRQLVSVDAALPFMTPERIVELPGYLQDIAYFQLLGSLAELNPSDPTVRYPYITTGVGGNPIQIEGQANPDNVFNFVFTQPDGTYVIHFTPGAATVDFNITTQLNFSPSNVNSPVLSGLTLKDLTPNADGSYTITVSPTHQAGNWIDSDGATGIWVRDTENDWTASPGSITVDRTDIPSSGTGYTPLSESDVTEFLNNLADDLPAHNISSQFFYTPFAALPIPENGVIPFIPTDLNGGLPGQFMSVGSFDLQPGQALIITEPTVDADYSNIQLANPLGELLPYQYAQTTLNNMQAVQNADGNTYYVISATNPGVPNWLDTGGLTQGDIFLRVQGLNGSLPAGMHAQVVAVDDIRDYLPADTPTVTPEQFAAQLELRSFSVQNLLSASKDHSWITTNLQIDDIKEAIGTDKFDQLFGTQDTVVPLAQRFTDILDPATAAYNLFSNPVGSLDAVLHALPQTLNDVEYPIVLAAARAARAMGDAVEAVNNGISTGHWQDVFTALAQSVNGPEGLASVLAQAIFDPDTSITAGLLNARDDIQFALVTGVDGTPDLSQLLSDAHESLSQSAAELTQNLSLATALIEQLLGF